jgi:hypothetical protein
MLAIINSRVTTCPIYSSMLVSSQPANIILMHYSEIRVLQPIFYANIMQTNMKCYKLIKNICLQYDDSHHWFHEHLM